MKKGSARAKPATLAAMEDIDSISEFESEFHHAFMKSRLDHDDFVYKTSLLRDLDEFCDVDSMHVPKGPLIVFGEPGSGKSAFLANWINRRKKKFQNWNNGFPEFIFYHAVGCTRQGAFVSKLLERILTEMKEYFELAKEVPTLEERLSWQFPRYLDAASRKGRTILIVDGVHRLRTSDGDSILKWLPLSFPPNVRLVLASTSATATQRPDALDTDLATMERIKIEAVRRNWTTVHIAPFSDDEKRTVVYKFLSKVGGGGPSLQLFELQQKAIASVARSANPMFLKTMLVGLEWVAAQGYNIHAVLREWLAVTSISGLFEVLLRCMEAGYTTSPADTHDAMLFLQEHSLDATFAWVPQSLAKHTQQPTARNASTTSPDHDDDDDDNAMMADPDDDGAYHSDDECGTPRVVEETDADVTLVFEELPSTPTTTTALASDDDGGPRQVVTSVLNAPSSSSSAARRLSDDVRVDLIKPADASSPSPSRPTTATGGGNAPLRHVLERVKTQRNIAYPVYVTGGHDVPGLGTLLGKALCVLYVARHGLLIHELRMLVHVMTLDEQKEGADPSPETPDEDDEDANLAALLDDGPPSRHTAAAAAFPESTWTTLLSALAALGCLFLQDIVLFPICYDALRDMVWWRYLGSPKAEQKYHHWLVRFFISHPPTFRRVEELPWHLASCRRWYALKDVLVNLPMFQLFFTANYKTELFCYWKMLTEGDYVSGSASPPPLNAPPDGLDTASAQPAIVTFDLVREYNKSIEDWYNATRPTTKQLVPMLQMMTKFVYEYSVFSQSELPSFNHPPFDAKDLSANGFHFVNQLPHILAQQLLDHSIHYLYQRWVWVQFPWLALGHEIEDADCKHMTLGSQTSLSPQLGTQEDDVDTIEMPDGGSTGGSSSHKPLVQSVPATAAPAADRAAASPATNPTLAPAQSMPHLGKPHPLRRAANGSNLSPFKLKAIANASLPTIVQAAAPSTLDIVGPNSPTHVLMRKKTQFVGFKNAPTSSFPTQLLKHASLSSLDDGGALASGVGKLLSQRTAGTALSIRDTANDNTLAEGFGLPAHLQEYSKTEADIKKSCNQQILFKLQQSHNYLRREANTKNARLETLRQKIRERKAKQSASLQYIKEAEEALAEMTKRMEQVDATLKVVGKQETTYLKLLQACEEYPAADKHHLARVKKELKFLAMKLRDLEKEHAALAFEHHHLATVEYPQLAAACADNKRLHDAVLDRLDRTRQRMVQDQANIEELYAIRKGIIDRVKSTAFDLKSNDTIELEKILHVQATAETMAANKSQVAKTALVQCQSMCRRIMQATGLSSMAAVHEKFNNREALNHSLDEQAALYEARLKQIKMSHAELEAQMKGLETIPKDAQDPRQLEALARDAEASLGRVQGTYASQLHALNEVIVGVSNIARLAGITDVRRPKRGLVPAAELWPPYQDKDMRAGTLAQFEMLPPAAMSDIIRVCEERMVAIIDNNEHGRGDPDALYALSRHSSRRESSAGLSPRSGPGKRRGGGVGGPRREKQLAVPSISPPRKAMESTPRDKESSIDSVLELDSLFSLPSTPYAPSSTSLDVSSPRRSTAPDEDAPTLTVLTREHIKIASKHKLAVKRKEAMGRSTASMSSMASIATIAHGHDPTDATTN
ncbi:Aste57867_21765 [Aphanomyces stellatus]|uniref:Aste57867_21765 protein n=1 Tax=Aphanomyces stellatus TaxID=120398 RepID=A0A485LJL9_9STRA|nr:hypothetical protein As57867_021696 [Aphanomyces stellatus]VFT98434.1 Aste57867_21765 [Aphanomyces stellatus]